LAGAWEKVTSQKLRIFARGNPHFVRVEEARTGLRKRIREFSFGGSIGVTQTEAVPHGSFEAGAVIRVHYPRTKLLSQALHQAIMELIFSRQQAPDFIARSEGRPQAIFFIIARILKKGGGIEGRPLLPLALPQSGNEL
jgi:hypothetical protein